MTSNRIVSLLLASTMTSALALNSLPVVAAASGLQGPALAGSARQPNASLRAAFGSNGPDLLGRSPAQRGLAADVATLRDGRVIDVASRTTPIHVAILMRAQHEDEMRALAAAQGTRGSQYYRKFISARQFLNYFAPSIATTQRTAKELQKAGFRIERINANRTMIMAVAPAETAGRYFKTSFVLTRQTGRPVTYANVTPAIVPQEMKNDIVGVAGLHTFRTMHSYMQHLTPEAKARLHARSLRTRLSGADLHAALAQPTADPRPITTSPAAPGPAATDTVETPTSDLTTASGQGYGPPIFSTAYDYPTQHGYNGAGHAAGSVIDVDYSDDDLAKEYTQYAIKPARVAGTNEFRVCYDGTAAGTTAAASCLLCQPLPTSTGPGCDTDGESTLDAEAIMTMAPGASFYEFIAPNFSDSEIEQSYEAAVSQDIVDAVNSSFGGCETDDPGFQYAANYIGLEGALEGITFSASTGDTGGESCGLYATNGVPQTFTNVSSPAAAQYFTGVGGTSFDTLLTCTTTSCYTSEQAWLEGGGGSSVLQAMPSWQQPAVAAASPVNMDITTGRDIPDVALTADGGVNFIGGTQGNGLIICAGPISGATPCDFTGSGGTSLSSPLFVALQTEVNQVTGSRNGWVNPRLYAIAVKYPGYAFRDLTVGNNERYFAGTGYDMATGLGSPLGFELASSE